MKSIIAVVLLITLSLLNTTGTADDTESVSDQEVLVEEAMIQGTDEDAIEEAEETAPAEETAESATVFEEVTEETEILPVEKSEKPVVHAAKKVVITEDNFFDYFELVETRMVRSDLYLQTTSELVTVSVRLKNDVMLVLPYGFENKVEIAYSYVREDYEFKDHAGFVLLNPSATKIPSSGEPHFETDCSGQIVFPNETELFTSEYTFCAKDDNVTISRMRDLVFDSVSGTLYISF